jgi:hypothetical protein
MEAKIKIFIEKLFFLFLFFLFIFVIIKFVRLKNSYPNRSTSTGYGFLAVFRKRNIQNLLFCSSELKNLITEKQKNHHVI